MERDPPSNVGDEEQTEAWVIGWMRECERGREDFPLCSVPFLRATSVRVPGTREDAHTEKEIPKHMTFSSRRSFGCLCAWPVLLPVSFRVASQVLKVFWSLRE